MEHEEQVPEQIQACRRHLNDAREDNHRVRGVRRDVVKKAREGGNVGDITAELFDELLSLHAQSLRSMELVIEAVSASFDFTGEIAAEMDERMDQIPDGEFLSQASFGELRTGLLFGLEAAAEAARMDPSKAPRVEAIQRALMYLEGIEVESEEEPEEAQGPLSPGQIQDLATYPGPGPEEQQ